MARILHISCDFPDVFVPHKTQAIRRLLEGTPMHEHTVYSLNRVDGLSGIEALAFGDNRFAIAYRAPPKGLLLHTKLLAVGQFILADIRDRGLLFDLVHAHKLTIDGIVGHFLATQLGLPIAFSVQGDTDFKVISARPDLTGIFKQHVHDASHLFCFAPWSQSLLHTKFPHASNKTSVLPVAPGHDDLKAASAIGQNRLVSVFHLESWKRKNLVGIARALVSLSHTIPDIHLDVFGGGSAASFLKAREALAVEGAEEFVTLKGPIANASLSAVLQNYAAFVLPTLRESYGLVHAEALFAGLPVLISRDMGIDGLVPPCDFVFLCEPKSTPSIAAAVSKLLENEVKAKAALAQAQSLGTLDHLRRTTIFASYAAGLQHVLQTAPSHMRRLKAA
jgi:glycosyltransferase involved in cell wall biosynthesis